MNYDLMLLDMQMPAMDGLTLAKCLAQIPALANLPIILLSSGDQLDYADYQDTGIVQRLLNLPALANAAHAIKGTVVHFYAEPARACASQLEQAARSGQSADYQFMTNALIKAVEDLINNLGLRKNLKTGVKERRLSDRVVA